MIVRSISGDRETSRTGATKGIPGARSGDRTLLLVLTIAVNGGLYSLKLMSVLQR
jgi:hypothetical protein